MNRHWEEASMEGPLWRFLYSFRSNELTNMTATTNSISDWSIFKIFENVNLVIFITGKENGGNYRHLYSRLKDLILILHVLSSSSHLSISKVIGDGDFQIWALKWWCLARPTSLMNHITIDVFKSLNWYLVESMYGRPSVKIAHFVPIR